LTPCRPLLLPVLGIEAIDQAEPSHDSTTGAVPPPGGRFVPTALQKEELMQETESSVVSLPLRLGVGTIVHAVPSKCSASEPRVPPSSPTAQQSVALTHVIPKRYVFPLLKL
jgi:hypothetical protein